MSSEQFRIYIRARAAWSGGSRRAAWFLLTAAGVLPATLLQIGSAAEPLFGAPNVKEIRLDTAEWDSLRDLLRNSIQR